MRTYDYVHTVGFEDTNIVGNVYYVNYLRWQGRCREMFLRDHCPEILAQLAEGLCLVTTHCACDYLAELTAFEEVLVRMRLSSVEQNRIGFLFTYVRCADGREEVVARGEQRIACMWREGDRLIPTPIPPPLST